MVTYQHILVAIDTFDEYKAVVDKALELRGENTRLSIVTCIQPIPYPENYAGGLVATLQQQVQEDIESRLAQLIEEKDISILPEDLHICLGSPGKIIQEFAVAHQADLVVTGGHGKHGIQLLFGSTSSHVVKHAEFDVLVVSLKKVRFRDEQGVDSKTPTL